MTALERRLVNNYATVIMGRAKTIDDVPHRVIVMQGGAESTLKEQVEIEIARREIEIIEGM